jgi:hypothetical protein
LSENIKMLILHTLYNGWLWYITKAWKSSLPQGKIHRVILTRLQYVKSYGNFQINTLFVSCLSSISNSCHAWNPKYDKQDQQGRRHSINATPTRPNLTYAFWSSSVIIFLSFACYISLLFILFRRLTFTLQSDFKF